MNKLDFKQPMLQSSIGIFVFFFVDIAKDIRRYLALFVIIFVSKSARENMMLYFWLLIFLMVIVRIIFSYLKYKNFQFHLEANSFILKHGVIRKSKVEIPFERIQNINIEQNILQQILQVVGVQIETAGEGDAEIQIKALDRNTANALKKKLLEEKRSSIEENQVVDDVTSQGEENKLSQNEPTFSADESEEEVFKLTLPALLKVGVSSNFFKGIAFLFVFIGTIYNFVIDVLAHFIDIDFDEDFLDRIPETASLFVGVVLVFLFLGFIITVVSTVTKYFGLRVVKTGENYELTYGLFKRITQVIKKSKTQVLTIETNPIRKLFGFYNVFVSQASSRQLTEREKIGLVGINKFQFRDFFEAIFESDVDSVSFNKIASSKRLFIRLFWRSAILFIGITLAHYFIFKDVYASIAVLTLLVLLTSLYNSLVVKKSYLGVSEDMICIGSGSIHTKQTYLAMYKIQSVQLKQNIFQRFNNHADVVIYTASGSIHVPYLPYQKAIEAFNFALYKVESSELSWI